MERMIINIIDGEIVDNDIVERFNLKKFCSLNNSGEYVSEFVGIVMNKDEVVFSSPKHYKYLNDDDIKTVLGCMLKGAKSSGPENSYDIETNIPYSQYLYVLDYYNRFGIHKERKRIQKKTYSGKVDWQRTSRESEKIISGNNLIFLPFYVDQIISKETYIGKCMRYVLNDGYERFGKYIGFNTRVECLDRLVNNDNLDFVIKKLQEERNLRFKDNEIHLIDAIIGYIKWVGGFIDDSFFVTKSFDSLWENMVNEFLSRNYFDYDDNLYQIIFKKNCSRYAFKKKTEYIQSDDKIKENGVKFYVEYDHYVKDGNMIIVFDSKYYKRLNEANYKQIAYHYFLMNRKDDVDKPDIIINGLIIPFEGDYYSRIHIDRTDIDGVLIISHYLNLKMVMNDYIS